MLKNKRAHCQDLSSKWTLPAEGAPLRGTLHKSNNPVVASLFWLHGLWVLIFPWARKHAIFSLFSPRFNGRRVDTPAVFYSRNEPLYQVIQLFFWNLEQHVRNDPAGLPEPGATTPSQFRERRTNRRHCAVEEEYRDKPSTLPSVICLRRDRRERGCASLWRPLLTETKAAEKVSIIIPIPPFLADLHQPSRRKDFDEGLRLRWGQIQRKQRMKASRRTRCLRVDTKSEKHDWIHRFMSCEMEQLLSSKY